MKNYLTTSLKSATTSLLLLMLVCIGSNSLLGQSVEIVNPPAPGPVEFCDLVGTEVTFDAEIEDDNGDAVNPATANVLILWEGPNGFTSSMVNPMLTFNSSTQSGDYIVTITFNGGETVMDTVSIEVIDGIDFECPDEPIRVAAGSDCTIVLDENLEVEDLNCDGAYSYCAELVEATGPNTVLASNEPLTEADGIDLEFDGFTLDDLGTQTVLLTIKLGGEEVIGCEVELELVEGLSNVACNDDINVTLDDNCQAVITPDMLLEGDFCYDAFTLTADGITPGNSITLMAPGTYTVTVSSDSGNCWGMVTAEDKTIPEIICPTDPVEIRCSVEDMIAPGSGIMDQKLIMGEMATAPAADEEGPGCVDIPFDFSGFDGTVTGIELDFLAMIDSVQNLSIMLISPDPDNNDGSTSEAEPDTITVADLCTVNTLCPFSNLDVSFRDFALLPYSSLGDSVLYCRSSNTFAHLGAYRPSTPFSFFNGNQVAFSTDPEDEVDDDAIGVWTLRVCNKGATPITGIETAIRLTCESEEGILGGEDFTGVTGCGSNISFTFTDEQMNSDCTNPFSKIITRTWTVTNEDSGFSNSCTHQINIRKWELDEIIFPENLDGIAFPALQCQVLVNNPDLITDDNIPLPALTGFPRVPFGELCDNIRVTFEDEKIPVCGEFGMKVLRRFTVLDWCDSNIREHTQVIKVDQRSDIIVSCPPNMMVVPTGSQCTGTADLEEPLFTPGPNSCASEITYTVGYLYDDDDDDQTVPPSTNESFERNMNISGNQEDGYTITNLPSGRTWVRYFFEDECGNTGACTTEIDVIDQTQPNPICIEFTVLALDEFGCATLPAASIDNNSWDNCDMSSDLTFDLDDPELPGGFSPTLMYCCTSDCVDGIRTVFLRVTDSKGNSNSCEVEVEIQNNFNAVIVERPITSQEFDCADGPVNIGELLLEYEEDFVITSNCNNAYEFELTYSNGQPVGEDDIFEPGECGGGAVSVKWTITDRCDRQVGTHNLSFTFTQNLDGFEVTRWPNDVTLNNCTVNTDPENLPNSQNSNNIRFTTSSCNSNVAITHSDQIFPEVDDACYKILRTWTVIDWCIVNNSTLDDGRRTYVQIIKVNDSAAPVITNLNDITVPADGASCSFFLTEAAFPIDLNITDNCTADDELQISFQVDGTPVASIYNRTYTASTGITVTAIDHCGNTNTGFFRILVEDTVPPTPYCRSSITTTVRVGGFAEVWTSDFDLGGTDNCDTNGLDVYFANGSTFMRWDCDDIPNGVSAQLTTQMFYRDDSGNVNSCTVQIFIQDTNDICPDGAGSIIGNIHTEEMHMIGDAVVDLMNMNNNASMTNMATANDGNYAFVGLNTGDYQVVPTKDDSYLNGVSTVDLVIIQRHILGIDKFNSPYKTIAADADNSGDINGIDLVTLRKLILGIITELPHGQQSWRFPTEDQQFSDVDQPFPFLESIELYNHQEDAADQNFVAVKVGDVNADAIVSFTDDQTENRSSQTLQLQVQDKGLVPGTVADVAVKATNMEDIAGFQTTLSFNADVMQFMGVTAEGLEVTEANLGLTNLDDGYITLSWNNTEGVTVENFRTLFTLHFDVKESGNLSEQLFLSSVWTKSEAYTGNLETVNLELDYEGADLSNFVLYQNIPNPFNDNPEVRFNLPAATQVTFSVFDVNGRILMRNTSDYEGGSHSILLTREDLASTGVMYYKIETAFGTASRKMIQIR